MTTCEHQTKNTVSTPVSDMPCMETLHRAVNETTHRNIVTACARYRSHSPPYIQNCQAFPSLSKKQMIPIDRTMASIICSTDGNKISTGTTGKIYKMLNFVFCFILASGLWMRLLLTVYSVALLKKRYAIQNGVNGF